MASKFCSFLLSEDNRSATDTADINPLNAELNPICHLLALLGGATIVVISRLRVNIYALDSVVAKLHVIQTVLLPIIVQFGSIHNLDNRTGK